MQTSAVRATTVVLYIVNVNDVGTLHARVAAIKPPRPTLNAGREDNRWSPQCLAQIQFPRGFALGGSRRQPRRAVRLRGEHSSVFAHQSSTAATIYHNLCDSQRFGLELYSIPKTL